MDDNDSFTEMENPGELIGAIMMDDDVPYLRVGDVIYDVTLTKDVPLKSLMDAVGKLVTVKVERIFGTAIAEASQGHIIVSELTVHEPNSAPS
jgi:hypothetical protein